MKEMNKIPLFWMNEQTGQMKKIVMDFMNKLPLSENALARLKWYIIQWIEGNSYQVKVMGGIPAIPPNYKMNIEQANQNMLSEYVFGELLDYGIDPF